MIHLYKIVWTPLMIPPLMRSVIPRKSFRKRYGILTPINLIKLFFVILQIALKLCILQVNFYNFQPLCPIAEVLWKLKGRVQTPHFLVQGSPVGFESLWSVFTISASEISFSFSAWTSMNYSWTVLYFILDNCLCFTLDITSPLANLSYLRSINLELVSILKEKTSLNLTFLY